MILLRDIGGIEEESIGVVFGIDGFRLARHYGRSIYFMPDIIEIGDFPSGHFGIDALRYEEPILEGCAKRQCTFSAVADHLIKRLYGLVAEQLIEYAGLVFVLEWYGKQ